MRAAIPLLVLGLMPAPAAARPATVVVEKNGAGPGRQVTLLPRARGLIQRVLPTQAVKVTKKVAQELAAGYRELGVKVKGVQPVRRTSRHADRRFRAADAFVRAVSTHAPFLRGHSIRTAAYAKAIARQMGLKAWRVTELDLAGRVHDLGKLGVASSVLHNRSGQKPPPKDWKTIERHPALGEALLRVPGMRRIRKIIAGHHENLDGTGYPMRKSGRGISLSTRILAVADAFDAMTCHRTYQRAMTEEVAIARLRELAGVRFDAKVVDALVAALPQSPLARAALRWAQRSPVP